MLRRRWVRKKWVDEGGGSGFKRGRIWGREAIRSMKGVLGPRGWDSHPLIIKEL